jgi:protein-S-isoprenylcysteine O-methyltransferase Ste14
LIEASIRALAVVVGILALIAPILVLSRVPRKTTADAVGREAGSSRVWRDLVSTAGLVLIGVILWRPVPLVLSEPLGLGVSVLGALMYFPAVGLYLWGLSTLGKVFRTSPVFGASLPTDHTLIERGPYRRIRHPMYLGVIFAAAGALLIFRTWAMVVFFPMSFIVLVRAEREEAALAAKHGKAWERYAARVPGWSPRFW